MNLLYPIKFNILLIFFSLNVFAKISEKKTITRAKNITTFSGPISNVPVKKIYIHGRPVYVRQMFVSPLRNHGFHRRSRDEVYSEQRSRLVAPASDSYQNSVTTEQEPIYAPASQPNIGPSSKVSSRFDEETYAQPKQPKYPLPECYTNDSGFMCCNKELESVMDDAFDELKNRRNSDWHSCNVQQIANGIQKAIEGHFNSTFEVIAGIGDYASKSHFYHNYICKMERDNRFLLAYATPKLGAEFPQNPQNGLGNVFGPPQKPKYKNGLEKPYDKAPYTHVWTL